MRRSNYIKPDKCKYYNQVTDDNSIGESTIYISGNTLIIRVLWIGYRKISKIACKFIDFLVNV